MVKSQSPGRIKKETPKGVAKSSQAKKISQRVISKSPSRGRVVSKSPARGRKKSNSPARSRPSNDSTKKVIARPKSRGREEKRNSPKIDSRSPSHLQKSLKNSPNSKEKKSSSTSLSRNTDNNAFPNSIKSDETPIAHESRMDRNHGSSYGSNQGLHHRSIQSNSFSPPPQRISLQSNQKLDKPFRVEAIKKRVYANIEKFKLLYCSIIIIILLIGMIYYTGYKVKHALNEFQTQMNDYLIKFTYFNNEEIRNE